VVDWHAIGVFLSGAGAVLSAVVSLRLVQRRERRACDERVAEVTRAIHEGYEMHE